jgi:hypothetical protein
VLATIYVDANGAVRSAGLASAAALDRDAARCVSAALGRSTVTGLPVHGAAVGRMTISLRNAELVAARDNPPKVTKRRRAKH